MSLLRGEIAAEYSGCWQKRPSGIEAWISGQIHVEEDGPFIGRDFDFARRGWDEDRAAALQVPSLVVGDERGATFDHREDSEAVVVPQRVKRAETKAVEDELVAMDEALDVGIVCHLGGDGIHWATGVIDYVQRLFDVELARLAVLINAVPVEQPVGRIAGLLDFGDQQTGAESVDGAGRNQNAVARARLKFMKTGLAVANQCFALECLPIHSGLQSGVNLAARFGGEHDPGFCFAEVRRIEPGCLFIVGVDLDRERLVAVEKFQKQWKSIARMIAAEERAAVVRD